MWGVIIAVLSRVSDAVILRFLVIMWGAIIAVFSRVSDTDILRFLVGSLWPES